MTAMRLFKTLTRAIAELNLIAHRLREEEIETLKAQKTAQQIIQKMLEDITT